MKIDTRKLAAMAKDHRSCLGRGYTGKDPKTGHLYLCGCVARQLPKRKDPSDPTRDLLDLTPIALDGPAPEVES